MIRLMDKILHDPKDPKLWELWYIPYNWVMQDFVHQPYNFAPLGFGMLQLCGFCCRASACFLVSGIPAYINFGLGFRGLGV